MLGTLHYNAIHSCLGTFLGNEGNACRVRASVHVLLRQVVLIVLALVLVSYSLWLLEHRREDIFLAHVVFLEKV